MRRHVTGAPLRIALAALGLLIGVHMLAADPLRWVQLDTDLVSVVFRERDRRAAERVATLAPRVFDRVSGFVGWRPPRPVPVVINGDSVRANGYFTPYPPQVALFVAPPTDTWLGSATDDWLELLFTHELTHFLHVMQPTGTFGSLSRWFGPLANVGLMALSPGWFVEGPAVGAETWLTDGGRGRNPFTEMTWVAPLIEGRMWSLDQAATSTPFAPRGRIYIGGYLLVDYLERTYGPDAFQRLDREFRDHPLLGVRSAVRRATGTSAGAVHTQMVAALEERYAARSRYPVGSLLSQPEPGNWALPVATERGLVTWASTHRDGGALRLLGDDGVWRPLAAAQPLDRFSWSVAADGRSAVVAIESPDPDGAGPEQAHADLWRVELGEATSAARASASTRLTRGRRLYHPAVGPEGTIYAVERRGDTGVLVELRADGSVVDLLSFDGAMIRTPAVSPDGDLIAAVVARAGTQRLVLYEPAGGTSTLLEDHGALHLPRFVSAATIWAGQTTGDGLRVVEIDRVSPGGGPPRVSGVVVRDAVGAYGAIDHRGRVLYASYRSTGFALATQPRAEAAPDQTSQAGSASGQAARVGEGPAEAAPGQVTHAEDRRAPLRPFRESPYTSGSRSAELRPPASVQPPVSGYRDRLRPVFWHPLVAIQVADGQPARADAGAALYTASLLGARRLDVSATVDATGQLPGFSANYSHQLGRWDTSATASLTSRRMSGGLLANASGATTLGREIAYSARPAGYRRLYARVQGSGEVVAASGLAANALLIPAADDMVSALGGSLSAVVSSAWRRWYAPTDPGRRPGASAVLAAGVGSSGATALRLSSQVVPALRSRRLQPHARATVAYESAGNAARLMARTVDADGADSAVASNGLVGAEGRIGVRLGLGPFDAVFRGWSISQAVVGVDLLQRVYDAVAEPASRVLGALSVDFAYQRVTLSAAIDLQVVIPHGAGTPATSLSFSVGTPFDAVTDVVAPLLGGGGDPEIPEEFAGE